MITFLDGPAEGQVLALRRAPLLLRVVINDAGELDALDQLDDEPRDGERIFVYRLTGPPSRYHLLTGCKGRAGSGWYMQAEYRFEFDQADDADLRETERWRAWALQQPGGFATQTEEN